jgi:hypothetical protein
MEAAMLWQNDDDNEGALKVVMTSSASDPTDWQRHIRSKARREALARRFRRPHRAPITLRIAMWSEAGYRVEADRLLSGDDRLTSPCAPGLDVPTRELFWSSATRRR